jgi:DNA-binding NarL/FixJ family response regulator
MTDPLAISTIVVADDHQLVRMGLVQVLGREPGWKVVGEAGSCAEVRTVVGDRDPDALVLDLQLSDGASLDLVRELTRQRPHLAILVVSMHDARVHARRCRAAGARGYLMKEAAAEGVVEALRTVLAGGVWGIPEGEHDAPGGVSSLSPRELAVFTLIAEGLATRDIASRLAISPKTIEAHKEHLKSKLGAASAAELLRLAMEWQRGRTGT